ncbi:MAG: GC-type dockerin domain-anchored protein [Phycisphaerales bacterium]
MMRGAVRNGVVVAAAFIASSGMAQNINLCQNNSFEVPGIGTDTFRYLTGADATLMTGWSLVHDNVGEASYLFSRNLYPVYNGDYAVALNDGDALETTIQTFGGLPHLVRVYFDPAAGSPILVQCDTLSQTFDPNTQGELTRAPAAGERQWKKIDLPFIASVPSQAATLRISNPPDGQAFGGVGIDNIVVYNCVWASREPQGGTALVGSTFTLSIEPAGSAPFGYVWRKNGVDIPGANGQQLILADIQPADAGDYSCVITSPCENYYSEFARVVVSTACPADIDDGTGTGTPDGGVNVDDLLYFFELFNAGDIAADLDDGNGLGTQDGAVTIDDLLFFISRWRAGC